MVPSLVFVCHRIEGTCYISTSTLKMDGVNFSKTLNLINHITWHHIPESCSPGLSMILNMFWDTYDFPQSLILGFWMKHPVGLYLIFLKSTPLLLVSVVQWMNGIFLFSLSWVWMNLKMGVLACWFPCWFSSNAKSDSLHQRPSFGLK